MCYGSVIGSLLSLIYNTYYTKRLIGYGYWSQMKDLLHILAHSMVMGILVWLVVQAFDSLWLQLFVGILTGMVYYVVGAKLMKFDEYAELMSLVKKKKTNV